MTVAGLLVVPAVANAQAGGGFVGTWSGTVDGVGKAMLMISAVGPDNLVQGRMSFELQGYQSTFGDKADPSKNQSRGAVSGMLLSIDSSLGGIYRLTLEGNRLTGTYTRGTTFSGKAEFTRD